MNTRPSLAMRMSWRGSFSEQGFYFRQAAAITITIGLYMHVTRAFLGDDLLLDRVYTPAFDRVLTIPMIYAAVTGLIAWRRIPFRSTGHKIGYGLIMFYIAGSVPLHVYNAYLHNSTEYLRAFPLWYTVVLYPVFVAIIWTMLRLPYRPGAVR